MVTKLLNEKNLAPPGVSRKTLSNGEFSVRECYECLVNVEVYLKKSLKSKVKKSTRAKSAGDVVSFARDMGWVL